MPVFLFWIASWCCIGYLIGRKTNSKITIAGGGLLASIMVTIVYSSVFPYVPEPQEPKQLTAQQKEMVDQRRQAEKERKAQEKRTAEIECKKELSCWAEKHDGAAIIAGQRLIEKAAKFDHRWTDSLLEKKITHYKWHNKPKGQIVFMGDRLQFQNAYGAWQNMKYAIIYDPTAQTILGIDVKPGRM